MLPAFIKQIRIKLLNWEYWPMAFVYGPVFPVFLWYCLRARSFFFTTASNPGIENGGLMMESKFGIDQSVPAAFRPSSLRFEPGTSLYDIEAAIVKQQLLYPLVVKPDIGSKGMGVTKVENAEQLVVATRNFPVPFLIQPFIHYPKEIGLFWVKMPGTADGMITGIARKEFLQVTGDGKQTILSLIMANPRYLLQLNALKKILGERIDEIIPAGKTELIVPYGNHARGALFLDDSRLISPQLTSTINRICNQINGFYFGRLDIRYNSWGELEAGKNFSIIELNGAGSEPTHIYDPSHSLFFAWKEIIRHWRLLWLVSMENKKRNDITWMKLSEGIKMIRSYFRYMKKCKKGFV